jgi:hypothetical protein
MLIFFPSFTPCNVGLYFPTGGKNDLEEKKKLTLQGASHTKIYREKNQNSPTLQGVLTYLPYFI